MNVLVDTPIWSYALRSPSSGSEGAVESLADLIRNQQALLIGPVRQEILSGYSDLKKFNRLKAKLTAFENTPIFGSDYEMAACFYNTCRRKGVQGSHIDFLICAVAHRLNVPIFTTDQDFTRYSQIVPIRLFQS